MFHMKTDNCMLTLKFNIHTFTKKARNRLQNEGMEVDHWLVAVHVFTVYYTIIWQNYWSCPASWKAIGSIFNQDVIKAKQKQLHFSKSPKQLKSEPLKKSSGTWSSLSGHSQQRTASINGQKVFAMGILCIMKGYHSPSCQRPPL